ncbi:carbohydrate ABC transporter permease [Streptacidiphilus sp. N1-10]|uniref:Carbohydrate ABC transporter permease n=1 Tax=Streptacidiphilus jeojiensis TaxID=3229225 RepID=A0ABV6Y1A1_9ACTN
MKTPSTTRSRFSTVLALLILAVLLFPVYWMVNASLQSDATSFTTAWFPWHPSLSGYRQALADQGGHLLVSLLLALGATAVAVAVATPAAYALAKFRLPGRGWIVLATLVTQMIPGIVIANALYGTYNTLHLLNSLPGLILADASLGIPFSILLMRSFMANVPGEIIEAARVDGAGRLRTFWSVVVPICRNGIVTAALFSFLFAWSDFLFALTLTSSGTVTPITLGIYQYLGAQTEQWSPVMASAVLACLPSTVLLVLAQRFIASGITGGAVK